MTNFNVNDWVQVRLTDFGRAYHRRDHDLWTAQAGVTLTYRPPAEDAEGWSKWQLWSLMSLFGPCMHMGCDVPFETDMRLANPKGEPS